MNEPLKRFRIYGYNSSLYFIVNIWKTKKDLIKNRKRNGLKGSCDAHVLSYEILDVNKEGKSRKRPIVGEINFYKSRLGAGIVSHECLHATVSILKRMKFNFSRLEEDIWENPSEEIVARVQGEFTRQITVRLIESGIY